MNVGDQVETSLGARGTVLRVHSGTAGRQYCEVNLDMGGQMAIPASDLRQPSAVVAAFDRRAALARDNPLLAFALYVEAAGDRRADCDVSADSLLTGLSDAARRAIYKFRGGPFENELYPTPRDGS